MTMLILLVAGMPGSGKEEFLTAARSMDIPFIRMGDIVRESYSSRDLEDARLSVGEFASLERERHGKDIWAKRALQMMHGDLFLVDGCRSLEEVSSYRELNANVRIIAIHASPSTRYQRLVERAREDAPKNLDEFNARDMREMSWGLGNVIALSDMIIDNSNTLDDFHHKSKKLLENVR